MTKLIAHKYDNDHIFTDFQTGEDTSPEQSYRELMTAVISFAKINAAAARKTGAGDVSWVQVLDKMISDLQVARDRIDSRINEGTLSQEYMPSGIKEPEE